MPPFKVATFDCYGTLVDWEGGAATYLYDLARRSGECEPESGIALRTRWEEIQFELLADEYRSYTDVLSQSLRAWVGERGYRWNENDGQAFAKSMQSWQPFADTIPALRRVREAGLGLAIVSNTEHSIMDHTLRQLAPIEFDHVVVAEDVHCYKPDRRLFTRMLDEASVAPEEVLHVAFGFKYDIGPAQELGLGTAWINRHREALPDGGTAPDYEWPNLWGLADHLESEAAVLDRPPTGPHSSPAQRG